MINKDAATSPPADAAAPALCLPGFWCDTPASWFAEAERLFRLHGITTEAAQLDHLLAVLPRDLLLNYQQQYSRTPYTELKNRLLAGHVLTAFEQMEQLFLVEPMGERTPPSQLLDQMLRYCPRGEERNRFFLFMFLQRLPRDLRVLLGDYEEDGEVDARQLATKADRLWATVYTQQQHGTVSSAVKYEEESALISRGNTGEYLLCR